jgi:hypothetical protein
LWTQIVARLRLPTRFVPGPLSKRFAKSSGVPQIEDRGEAAKKIRELMFGKYTKEQLEAAALTTL